MVGPNKVNEDDKLSKTANNEGSLSLKAHRPAAPAKHRPSSADGKGAMVAHANTVSDGKGGFLPVGAVIDAHPDTIAHLAEKGLTK